MRKGGTFFFGLVNKRKKKKTLFYIIVVRCHTLDIIVTLDWLEWWFQIIFLTVCLAEWYISLGNPEQQ